VPITAQAHALEVGALQLLADRRLFSKKKIKCCGSLNNKFSKSK
jgi:hypothetical protein